MSKQNSHSEAFSSSPRRPPTIGIYITHEDKPGAINYVSFSKDYSAARFIQDVQERHGLPDKDGDDLIFEAGWRLSTRKNSINNDLPGLLTYKHKGDELSFSIPEETKQRFAIFGAKRERPIEPLPETRTNERIRKPKPEGLIPLADLCKDPGEARKALRKSKTDKPQHGWAWAKDDPNLSKIKALLKNC